MGARSMRSLIPAVVFISCVFALPNYDANSIVLEKPKAVAQDALKVLPTMPPHLVEADVPSMPPVAAPSQKKDSAPLVSAHKVVEGNQQSTVNLVKTEASSTTGNSKVNIYQWVSQFQSSKCDGDAPRVLYRDVPLGSCITTVQPALKRANYDKVTVAAGKYTWTDYDTSAGCKVPTGLLAGIKPLLTYNCSTSICLQMKSGSSQAATISFASFLAVGMALAVANLAK